MDEFKPEDELKPDTSDRRPPRSRKASPSLPKVPVSRQHMMMGVGILVLLLLVLGIGSALKSPDKPAGQGAQQAASGSTGGEKSIDLSGSSSMSGQNTAGQPATAGQSPQELNAPPISSTPTEAQPLQTPQNQQRVELPGDLNNALSNQQGALDTASQAGMGASSLPTAPATVGGTGTRPVTAKASGAQPQSAVTHHGAAQQNKPATAHKPAASKPAVRESKPAATASTQAPVSRAPASRAGGSSTPGGNYTLQLSSASRSDTLNAWARKQNLSSYHVYQTTRNGQPWYVLVSGSYGTSAEAKRAVASLPAEVRAQNPWVKPVSQVKKEAGK